MISIKLRQLDTELPTPRYVYDGDAGCDLFSRIDAVLKPGERKLIPTGIAVSIPEGYAGFITPRSGLAAEHGISIVNSPGLIDSSYRGEICAILINHDPKKSFQVKRGDRICQLVILKVEDVKFEVVEELDKTTRSTRGFGSSGG